MMMDDDWGEGRGERASLTLLKIVNALATTTKYAERFQTHVYRPLVTLDM